MQILFCGQTTELCVVLAHLVINYLNDVLRGDNAEKTVVVVEYGDRRLGIVLELFDTIVDRFLRVKVREGSDGNRIKSIIPARCNQISQVDRSAELACFVSYENG